MIPIISVINLAIGAGSIYVAADIYLHIYKHTKNLEYFYFSLMFLFVGMCFILVGSAGTFIVNAYLTSFDYVITTLFQFLALASLVSVIELIYTHYAVPIFFWLIAILGAVDAYMSIAHILPTKSIIASPFIYYLPYGDRTISYLNGFSSSFIILIVIAIFLSGYINLRKQHQGSAMRSLYFVFGGAFLFVGVESIYFWYSNLHPWNMWVEALFGLGWLFFFGFAILKGPAKEN